MFTGNTDKNSLDSRRENPAWPCGLFNRTTVMVVSWSNDYQKLIDLITSCGALNCLASVALICAHSRHKRLRVLTFMSGIPAAL